MSWAVLLTRFGLAAAFALLLLLPVLAPVGRRLAAGLLERLRRPGIGAMAALVVVLTLGVRGALLPTFEPVDEQDVKEYVEKAREIADKGHPRDQETRADGTHFYRTLGYSLPLAGWFKVTGTRSLASARWFNVLVSCATGVLLLLLGAALGMPLAGRVAAVAHAVFLPAAQFALIPYSETWATFLVVLSAWLVERLRQGGATSRLAHGAALGLALGALVITRTEFIWLPIAAAAALPVLVRPRATAALGAVALLAGALVPLAVNHRMRDGYPGLLRTSVQGGLILYFGNNPIDVNGHGNATPAVARHVQELYARDRTGGLARDEALDWMRAHPGAVVANAPKKAFHLWLAEPQGFGWHARVGLPGGLDRDLARVLRWLAYAQSLALLLLGVLGLRHPHPTFRVWTALLAAHLLMWCLLASSTRNRYPLEPLLMVAAAAWVCRKTGVEAGAGPG